MIHFKLILCMAWDKSHGLFSHLLLRLSFPLLNSVGVFFLNKIFSICVNLFLDSILSASLFDYIFVSVVNLIILALWGFSSVIVNPTNFLFF
jgi:hypothetical protein